MSKAIFVIHKNIGFRRAIFFALLNPQLNGAGFAGIRAIQSYNLTGHTKLQMKCRGQGQFNGFKVTLRHKGLNDEPNYSFEQYFQVMYLIVILIWAVIHHCIFIIAKIPNDKNDSVTHSYK